MASQSACIDVMHAPYPKRWASIATPTDICVDLIGTFPSKGEGASESEKVPTLAALLLGLPESPDDVTITHVGNGAFKIETASRAAPSGARTVQGHCGDEMLSVPATKPPGFFTDWVTFGYEYRSVELQLAGDGSLLARQVNGGYGLSLLVIPSAESKASWFRYGRPGQATEVWLAKFRRMEVPALCKDSPILTNLNGSHKECLATAGRLFDLCASGTESVSMPLLLASPEDAARMGAVIESCISAHARVGVPVLTAPSPADPK